MQWLIDFFKDTWYVVGSLLDIVGNIFTGLVNLVTSLPTYISTLTTCISFLPEQLITWFSIGVTVTITFLIIGRRDGGD